MNIGNIPAKYARLDPQREALIDVPNERRLSFGELDEQVRRLANALRDDLGLARGDRVAVIARNCIEYMVVYYACARSGLIVQPINWRLAVAEMSRILGDGEPRVVVASAEYSHLQSALAGEVAFEHWLDFGEGSSRGFEALLAAASAAEPRDSSDVGIMTRCSFSTLAAPLANPRAPCIPIARCSWACSTRPLPSELCPKTSTC